MSAPTSSPIPEELMAEAEEVLDQILCNGPETGDHRKYAILDIARALLSEREKATNAERDLRLALTNLAHEMRFLLRKHPKMDGGLYRQRLTEAEEALGCVHNCNDGGICLAEHAGFPKSCPSAAIRGGQ